MVRFRRRWARAALIITLAVVGAGLTLRWRARKAAIAYGQVLQNNLFVEEQEARAGKRAKEANLLTLPDAVAAEKTLASRWNLLGADYQSRADEMRRALTYLHLQLNLPSAERFRTKPDFRHFRIQTTDRSDGALRAAIRTLVDDYMEYVGTH